MGILYRGGLREANCAQADALAIQRQEAVIPPHYIPYLAEQMDTCHAGDISQKLPGKARAEEQMERHVSKSFTTSPGLAVGGCPSVSP
jgi:hypothetical protein